MFDRCVGTVNFIFYQVNDVSTKNTELSKLSNLNRLFESWKIKRINRSRTTGQIHSMKLQARAIGPRSN